MRQNIRTHIERLPEGVYLATSADVQGLVVEAPTLPEAIEWARANAEILLQSQGRADARVSFFEELDFPLVIAA